MSSITTGMGMLALAAIGWVGWQSQQSDLAVVPPTIAIPMDPILAAALPGVPALPTRITTEPAQEPLNLPQELGASGVACGLHVSVSQAPPALAELSISDPCAPGGRVEVQHAGLSIGILTDAQGRAELTLPLMSDPARIEVLTEGSLRHVTRLSVPDLDQYHRAVLSWDGAAGLSLHAHERGAHEGMSGHVHPGARAAPLDALLGRGGFLTVLGAGQDGGQAMIYTFPRDTTAGSGRVRLSVGLPDPAQHCGTTLAATRHETRADGHMAQTSIEIALPACGTDMGSIRLQNLFQDIRIAGR